MGGSSGSKPKVKDATPSEFKGIRGSTAGGLEGIIDSGGGSTFDDFQTGPTVPLSSAEQGSIDQITRLLGEQGGLAQTGVDLLQKTAGGDFLGADGNPFLNQFIEQSKLTAQKEFERFTLPRLQQGFTAAGQTTAPGGSSPFDRAAAISTTDLLDRLSGIDTNIRAANFEAERGRQEAAARDIPQLTRDQIDNTIAGLQAQIMPRLIDELGIERGIAEADRQMQSLLQALQLAVAASTGGSATVLQGQARLPGLGENLLTGFVSGVGSGLAAG